MPRYTPESKDRVRDAVDFQALVEERTELKRVGSQLMGRCPFHDERTASFQMDPVKKVYICFGCGAKGDVFTFVQETQGLDFVQSLEFLADRAHVELERQAEDPATERREAERRRLQSLLARAAARRSGRTARGSSSRFADARSWPTPRGTRSRT
jgi:DNA primase